jgi:hypothetical protein
MYKGKPEEYVAAGLSYLAYSGPYGRRYRGRRPRCPYFQFQSSAFLCISFWK